MAIAKSRSKRLPQRELDPLFGRADMLLDEGKLASAFRLYLAGATAGDIGMQNVVGYLYDTAKGVHRNRELALYWYRRAYRRGDELAASNIGTVFRDEKKWARALVWFERAVKMGNADANLEIAKICLHTGARAKAVRHLKKVCQAKIGEIIEASRDRIF